ncbi:hypothetical protein PPL_01979 [Heterostelium album PN500]|uniref:Uncharacterized protein n=1 Tax=Heterostelium pallidum (strain ATCC 26659 / Pp 5 / PN500) TaxID=670386 RepID=D3B111_HETP5|nr:hypothetical protein PPL_01979 [Heterostelium album PN500]EFA84985.1 hypothetical protein PPL_01979 [Heterostelium album PN500]|eukprot:XP_020437095.1 hypothetical protein PPL_01979 [Heterostelium album PN500]
MEGDKLLDFLNLKTLTNFILIYDRYFKAVNDGDEVTQCKCVEFFVSYHNKHKYTHHFDVNGYIKLIVEVFFGSSEKAFKKLTNLKCLHQTSIQLDIYKRIITDTRAIYRKKLTF